MRFLGRIGRVLGVLLWVGLALAVSGRWIARAQQAAADDPRFTGKSETMEPTDLGVSRRRFEAGARSAWHSHARGQLLFVEKGRARTQKRGQPMREMGPNESDYTGPNVEHWHGAAPGEAFVQVAVSFGGDTRWLEKTTEAEYRGGR
jgi:quercetin dioxygenase-like cupin family protein